MKKNSGMPNVFLLIACLLLFACDKTELRTIDLQKMVPKKFSKNFSKLKLIESYPNFQDCTTDTLNANLYLCYADNSKDTVLIFEPCKDKLFEFVNTGPNLVRQKDIVVPMPAFVKVVVPASIKLDTKQYLVANLSYLLKE